MACACLFSHRTRRRHPTAVLEVVTANSRHQQQSLTIVRRQLPRYQQQLTAPPPPSLPVRSRDCFTLSRTVTWRIWSSPRMRSRPGHVTHSCCCRPPRGNSIHGSLICRRTSRVPSTSPVSGSDVFVVASVPGCSTW